jgi:hypothetical protein
MAKVALLNPLVASRVVMVADGAKSMDIEELIATRGHAAALRTIMAADPRRAAALAKLPAADCAADLRGWKAVLSAKLGEELAVDWPSSTKFPGALQQLFKLADSFL